MIINDIEFEQTKGFLEDLEDSLAELKQELADAEPGLFETFAAYYLKDIDTARQEIDEYIGVSLAQKERAHLWLKLTGENVEYGNTSARILSEWLKKVVDSFRNTVIFLLNGEETRARIPYKKFSPLYEINVATFATGSLEIGFKLPEVTQVALFEKENYPEEALMDLLKTASWIASDGPESKLVEYFPELIKRKVLLNEAMNLVPKKGSRIKSVELSGIYLPVKEKVILTNEHRERGYSVMVKIKELETEAREEKVELFVGWISEVNFNPYPFTFELRDVDDLKRKMIAKFNFDINLATDVYELLDYDKEKPRKVEVMGIRRDNTIETISIKLIE